MIDAEAVSGLLSYDPGTGHFVWKRDRNSRTKAGDRAGALHKRSGYAVIKIDSRPYPAHRLAFAIMNGRWPADEVDHINGIKADNRWSNLRDATKLENTRHRGMHKNNRHGAKGVEQLASGRWRARIWTGGKIVYLGNFATCDEAKAAYMHKAQELFGAFARAA